MTDELKRIPMDRAYKNLKLAIRESKNRSPFVFDQAYYFIETFRYNHQSLVDFEKLVNSDIKSSKPNSEDWRSLNDIIHAIRAQKEYDWSQ